MAQKTQSYKSVLKLDLHVDMQFQGFVFAFAQLLSYWNSFTEWRFQQSQLRGIYISHICSCLSIFEYIIYITYLNIEKMEIKALINSLANV